MIRSCGSIDILMGERLSYTLTPSLERGALIKTATILWNQDDIWDLITKIEIIRTIHTERHTELVVIENKVKEKVHRLPLPESLKEKVSDFIKPVGIEILKWSKYHERLLPEKIYAGFVRGSLNKLCWTSQGTVDRKKTVEALIKDESLDITERYTLACIYCLKNDILTLWNKMPENCRRSYYFSIHTFKIHSRVVNQEKLVRFWTYGIHGDVHRMEKLSGRSGNTCDSYLNAFEYAVSHGNKVATEYFLQNLTSEEREKYLVESAERIIKGISGFLTDCTDILCFLLSQMTEEQHLKVLKKYPYEVLESLLDWPRQDSFLGMAKHVWAFLSKNNYYSLLTTTAGKVLDGYKDYNYQKLFREFWQQSPITHKEYVIDACAYHSLLFTLFQIKDIENIKLILEVATSTDRKKIIFSVIGRNICKSLIHNKEMDLLEFFVQKCISSKDIMIKFREKFEGYTVCLPSVTRMKVFLNDLIETYDSKRVVKECNSGPAKRLCR